MFELKCMSCPQLERQTIPVGGKDLVVFECGEGRFPYRAALSAFLRPSLGIAQAVEECPTRDEGLCLACKKDGEKTLGPGLKRALCTEHFRAWGTWLRDHPQKQDYFAPLSRARHARYLEVFWEFVASARDSDRA